MLHSLVDKGNTVLVIEHNLDVIKTADWIIDMGPEGGSGGGMVVAEGTPEQVAAVPGSHTGEFLRAIVKPTKQPAKQPAKPARKRTAAARTASATRPPPGEGPARKPAKKAARTRG